MIKSLVLRSFTYLEIGTAVFVGCFLSIVIFRGLITVYDFDSLYLEGERDFKQNVIAPLAKENKIDRWEAEEWLGDRSVRSGWGWITMLLMILYFAIAITIPVMWVGQVYKKYRSLQYRERLKKFLFTDCL